MHVYNEADQKPTLCLPLLQIGFFLLLIHMHVNYLNGDQ